MGWSKVQSRKGRKSHLLAGPVRCSRRENTTRTTVFVAFSVECYGAWGPAATSLFEVATRSTRSGGLYGLHNTHSDYLRPRHKGLLLSDTFAGGAV